MKNLFFIFLVLFCNTVIAQVLIDQPRKEPTFIIKSKTDTIPADYLVYYGIFPGFIVRKTYTVEFSANNLYDGLSFDQIIEVLNQQKEPVQKVLAIRETLITGASISTGHQIKFFGIPNRN